MRHCRALDGQRGPHRTPRARRRPAPWTGCARQPRWTRSRRGPSPPGRRCGCRQEAGQAQQGEESARAGARTSPRQSAEAPESFTTLAYLVISAA
jgi:hypothetical protein